MNSNPAVIRPLDTVEKNSGLLLLQPSVPLLAGFRVILHFPDRALYRIIAGWLVVLK